MNKFAKRPISFDSKNIEYLTSLGFDVEFSQLLNSRGMTKDNVREYLDENYFFMHDPYLMTNMSDAYKVIKTAMLQKKKILIYGDYDADGLTATAILKLFFERNNIECDTFIPTREDGYGLHVDLVVNHFYKKPFDLLITVDCGISNKEEIKEIIFKLGIEVVVTDHHELPTELPNCLCINCKMGYPFAYLSGAGVALKLVEALSDRSTALLYADLAMVGTVADMMPLVDENRQIVKYGLNNLSHRGLIKLMEASKCDKNPTASAFALKICPKINSAGRVGVPYKALDLLLMADRASVEVVKDLMDCNALRQELLERVITEANQQIANLDISKEKILFLYSDDWPKGILGIGANRFKEYFKKPVVFLTKDADEYVGSARAGEDVNLYELFSSVFELLIRFGGHKSSVGFSVAKSNLIPLKEKLNMCLNDVSEKFVKTYYDLHFSQYWQERKNYEKLSLLEPYLPNDKPVFYFEDFCVSAGTFGNGNLKFMLNCGLEIKGFGNNYLQYLRPLKAGAEVNLCFYLEVDKYTNKLFGSLIDLELKNSLKYDDLYACNFLSRVFTDSELKKNYLDLKTVKSFLQKNNVVSVFNSYLEFEKARENFDFTDFAIEFFCPKSFSPKTVIISPERMIDLQKYENVIVFCGYENYELFFGENVNYYDLKLDAPTFLNGIKLDRKICAEVFNAISVCNVKNLDLHSFYENQFFYCDRRQFFAAIAVFRELGLIVLEEEKIVSVIFDKKNLNDSELFRGFNCL